MAVGMQGGAPEPPALSTLRTRFSTDLETIRGRFRFAGAMLIISGALFVLTILGDFRSGQAGRAMVGTIAAAALLIGGTKLVVQRYAAGLDTVRRSGGIVWLALGTLSVSIGFGLWGVGLGGVGGIVGSWADLLMLLGLLNLALGFGGILIGVLSLWSRRYAAWFQRRWEKLERRRNEKLGQRG
jgi:hypothetical protein